MKAYISTSFYFILIFLLIPRVFGQTVSPEQIKFVRQGTQRMIFNENQSIKLASLEPDHIIGLSVMHPTKHYLKSQADINFENDNLVFKSEENTETSIWLGGFNPFATYVIDLSSVRGNGELGFEFSDAAHKEQFFIKVGFKDTLLTGVNFRVNNNESIIVDKSVAINIEKEQKLKGKIILQMLGSGLTVFLQNKGLPKVIGQVDFNTYIDLRKKHYLKNFQTNIFLRLNKAEVQIKKAKIEFSTGIGLADIRAITYENGDPYMDQDRLWYTMSIRGRGLPHHLQGVFSMNPTIFDIKLEGVILFDRNDGLLRNEIASHIFYDRNKNAWRGITTGFSAYANPEKEKKQLLAVESKKDPRFGFSIMKAVPFGMIGDIEDPHIIFDEQTNKWRLLACKNNEGYKAIMLESDNWDKGYHQIAGPVSHNSTGTSIQKIGNQRYCFSGSSEHEIFIYTYPHLKKIGNLKMDLAPWDETSGTRVWPNVLQLPDGYPFQYIALMMDRLDYPGQKGPHWSYGAIYLYHGYNP